ncbi:MAG: GNAT family N-acetyltransferase [Wenzhouxiangellaceae bacterium]|nr:GNAT family N-acetyltransferase [Wenzhouxiangellaceae bacterium]
MTPESKPTIRPARSSELPRLAGLVRGRLPDLMKPLPAAQRDNIERQLSALLPDDALLLSIEDRRLTGVAALDLDHANLMAMYLDPDNASAGTARALVRSAEAQARAFGIRRLQCSVKPQAWSFMERLGYRATGTPDERKPVELSRNIAADASDWEEKVARLHRELGIPEDYGVRHRLRIVAEAEDTVSIGLDIFEREVRMEAEAARRWAEMQADARRQNIDLQPVSGFRNLAYQAEIIRRKLSKGQQMARILRTSAAPGYTEHHTGRALDVTVPGISPLTAEFAETRAYDWLKQRAGLYGFHESFPQRNRHSIEWEPWHWCYRPRGKS